MATEQETDYETGDPSGQQTGYEDMDSDDMESDEEGHEKPARDQDAFTDFDQFERFESSDELLHALTEASEEARKLLEDRVKDGAARMPRGGIPDNDLYVMQHLSFFVGLCEARVHRLPNPNSRPVQILKQKVEDNLDLINRWLNHDKQLHGISTKGLSTYIHNQGLRDKKIGELRGLKQRGFHDLNKLLGGVLEGMKSFDKGKQAAPPVAVGGAETLIKKLRHQSSKSKDPTKFAHLLLAEFDTFIRDAETHFKDSPKYHIYQKFDDPYNVFFHIQNAVAHIDQGTGPVSELTKWIGEPAVFLEWVRKMLEFREEWNSYEQRPRLGRRDRFVEEKLLKKDRLAVAKSKGPPAVKKVRSLPRMPPTPQIKAAGRKIMTIIERKNANKALLEDIQQGWEEGGAHSKAWIEQIKGIVDAFKSPLAQQGLTQATVDGWIEKNLYQKWYNRYGERSEVIRPSGLFSNKFVTQSKINIPRNFKWLRKAFKAPSRKKEKYISLFLEAIQNEDNYDAWVAKQSAQPRQVASPPRQEDDEEEPPDQEDEKLDQPKQAKAKGVFNAVKTYRLVYDQSTVYFKADIHGLFDEIRKSQLSSKTIDQIISHFKELGNPDPKNLHLFSEFMREDEKTVRAKYQEFSLPDAIKMCFDKFSAEIDFEFHKLKPFLIEQYTSQPLSEADITKLDPLSNTKIEDLPDNLSKFINNLVLTVQQTSIAELIRRRSPDRPQMSSVGQAASPPSNLEQLKTTIAKLTATVTELEKTITVGKAQLLKLTTAPATSKLTSKDTDDIFALQRLLKKQTVERLQLRKDLERNQEHLLHFDKVEGRRWEDENVRLQEALEKTEKAWAGLGGEIQKVALLKELSKQEIANVNKEFETAQDRLTRYTKKHDKIKGWLTHPSTRDKKHKTDEQVSTFEKSIQNKLDVWGKRLDEARDIIDREKDLKEENVERLRRTNAMQVEYAEIEKEVHRISAALEKHAGEKPSPWGVPAPPENVASQAVRDAPARQTQPQPARPSVPATPPARPRRRFTIVPDHPNQIPGQIDHGGDVLNSASSIRSMATTIYYGSPLSARRQEEFRQAQPDYDRFGSFPTAPAVMVPPQLGAVARAQEEEDFKAEQRRVFVARRGNAILDQDFQYDYDRRRWVPKLQQFQTYVHYKHRGDDIPYRVPAEYAQEVAWVQRRTKHAEYLQDGGPERFLREQRETNPLAKPSSKSSMIGDHITVKIYPHSIHFIFTQRPHKQAVSIMSKRIIEHVKTNDESRLLTTQVHKGRKTIKTLISQRDMPNLSQDQLQNIIVRSRSKHFILRFEMYGGAIHTKYDRDFHLL